MGIDYYGVLGISKHSTDLEIKQAFRRLAIQYNPERQKNELLLEPFELITEAYDVLSQPKLKALYDQFGEEGLKKGIPTKEKFYPPYIYHGNPLRTFKEFFGTVSPYADLLGILYTPQTLFDFDIGKGIKKKETDFIRPLELTLYEVYTGATKKMKIQHRVFVDDSEATTTVCEKVLTIPIKPGLPPGTEIVFSEAGDQGHSIIPGDVVFVTEDIPHEKYSRVGTDMKTVKEVTLKEALTGVKFNLETLDHRILHINITQVVTPDYVKLIPHEGMPCVDDPSIHGNLLINFHIKFPIYLPKSSKIMIKKAMDDAKRSGTPGSPDHIQRLIFLDKLQRMTKTPERCGTSENKKADSTEKEALVLSTVMKHSITTDFKNIVKKLINEN
ncbi:dnaJ homolog subfamily B member 13-like [Lycorma delicatula]|uniref:dnaJ homolog subfamily B member 13-like n=1 Tax=Lycorma delicatula TaxID=130591 RepID=UPI003F514482